MTRIFEAVFLVLVVLGALFFMNRASAQRSQNSALLARIDSTQREYGRRVDSLSKLAASSDSVATAWRNAARNIGVKVDSLQGTIDALKHRTAKVKDEIKALPDSALVERFNQSL